MFTLSSAATGNKYSKYGRLTRDAKLPNDPEPILTYYQLGPVPFT